MKYCLHVITAVQIHRWSGMLRTFGGGLSYIGQIVKEKNGKTYLRAFKVRYSKD